jgi:hypothetical protein
MGTARLTGTGMEMGSAQHSTWGQQNM